MSSVSKYIISGNDLYHGIEDISNLRKFLEGCSDLSGEKNIEGSILKIPQEAIVTVNVVISRDRNGKRAPMLERTGSYPPGMIIPSLGGRYTTDADEQRYGQYPLSEREWGANVGSNAEKDSSLRQFHESQHCEKIKSDAKGRVRVIMQGLGDIEMNEWCIAVNDREILHAPLEKLDERFYSCISRLKPNYGKIEVNNQLSVGNTQLIASEVAIKQYEEKSFIFNEDGEKVYENEISIMGSDFTVYGQRIVWDGKLVERGDIVSEFSDLRHLFKFPNINPKDLDEKTVNQIFDKIREQLEKDSKSEDDKDKCREHFITERDKRFNELVKDGNLKSPRCFFGMFQTADMWLGEYALLKDPELCKVACHQPISIPITELGTSLTWATICLIESGFKFKDAPHKVKQEGDFSWDFSKVSNPKLRWRMKQSKYPCSMIGIGGGHLFLLAWRYTNGFRDSDPAALTIFECGEILRQLGAKAVLLMDEGSDVFQRAFSIENGGIVGDIKHLVSPGRNRLKGTISFAIKE